MIRRNTFPYCAGCARVITWPFFHLTTGGYVHDDGRYTEENTLQLMLLNAEESTVTEIAKDLCTFFHQESVMVTKSACSVVFIRDSL